VAKDDAQGSPKTLDKTLGLARLRDEATKLRTFCQHVDRNAFHPTDQLVESDPFPGSNLKSLESFPALDLESIFVRLNSTSHET
jgi:hypothetical protein